MDLLLVAKKLICTKDEREPLLSILYSNANWVGEATQEEIESIYQEKSVLFNSYTEAEQMPGAWELLQKIKNEGLVPMVVTGSGQLSLLERLEHNFPGTFHKELMVTAFDVKYGKPNLNLI